MAMAQSVQVSRNARTLHVAFELGAKKWVLAFGAPGKAEAQRTVKAGDIGAVLVQVQRMKERLGLPADGEVVTVYEAGRDGFWLHRWLESEGFRSQIVDSASIKVNRRQRRVKTDRLDASELVSMLVRQEGGERNVFRVLQVPSREDEDLRRLQRQIGSLKSERNQHLSRIRGVLVTYGIQWEPEVAGKDPAKLREPTGEPLGKYARRVIEQEWESAELLARQIKEIEAERKALERSVDPQAGSDCGAGTIRTVAILSALKGIGPEGAWTVSTEMLGWRQFRNRKQVGSLAGLCGSMFASGELSHDQGISKAGNSRVRSTMTEVMWFWLRYQPDSAITRWFYAVDGTSRQRRVRIVACARKLLIALRRWVEFGEVPTGAVLSPRLPAHVRRVLEAGWDVPEQAPPRAAAG